jgi:ABC-type nickel/cobalt efflux system permease component RcnA
MTDPLLVALTTAALLGVTHAVEPDHVAGISSLTSRYGDPRLSALVGACFSLGHVALVVVWLGIGYLLLGRTEFPAVLDTVGTAGVAVLLGLLGAAMAVGGFRTVIRDTTHEHDGETHSHPHLSLPLPGFDPADHDHTTGSYLKTGLVGALFTLSPPLSMIAFASTLLPNYGGGAIALAVVVYAVGITATMSLLGAGVGGVFGLTGERSVRVHGGLQAVAGVVVAGLGVSLAVGALPALF